MSDLFPSKHIVLYVAHSADWMGSDKSLYDMLNALKEYVCPIVIVPNKGFLTYKFDERGIEYYVVPYRCDIYLNDQKEKEYWQFIDNIIAAQRIVDIVKDKRIDIIHSNSSVCDVGALVAMILKRPHIWHLREMIKDQFNGKYWNAEIKKVLFGSTAKFIAISQTVEESFKSEYGIEAEQVYNVVSDYSDRVEFSAKDKNSFLFAGGLYERKGIWDAIKATEYLKKTYGICIKLYVAGNGRPEERWVIDKYIVQHDLIDNIKFIDFKNNLTEWREKCQFSLTCSWKEALGRTTIEAMQSCMVPIGADTGGTKEIIGDDETRGFIYKSKDYVDLSNVIMRAINKDEKTIQIMSQNAADFAKCNFGQVNFVSRMVKIYRSCINECKDSIMDKTYTDATHKIQEWLMLISKQFVDSELVVEALWNRYILGDTPLADKIIELGYEEVGIYGMGFFGQRLFDELERDGINIKCVKDACPWRLGEVVKIYSDETEIPTDLLWIIAVKNGEKEIKDRLMQKDIKAIGLSELLADKDIV